MKIKYFNIKNPLGVFFMAAFIFGAAFYVLAQTQTNGASDLPTGVTQEQAQSALSDLGSTLGQKISTIAQAKEICNQERFLTDCVEVGKRHDLYSKNEIKQVNEVFTELKTVLADDLKKCEDESCFVDVANKIAKTLAQKNPDIAKQLDLIPKKIEEKRIIANVAKDVGVNVQECQSMDPDTAPIDLLRSCARLAKDTRIQKYFSPEVKKAAKLTDTTLDLREALSRGEFQCGDGTLEGCGNYCLNPGEAARAQGVSAIPSVCREIATRFFGPEGVKGLESAHQQVQQVQNFYTKKAENVVFTTLDGRTISNPVDIGNYLEAEGKKGNVEAVGKGMDFMVANGFIHPEDKEFALKIVQKVKEQGGLADFDACRQNSGLCRNFVPDDQREHFDAFKKIEDIMRQEVGFDPIECRKGEFNEDIALKCFEGSKQALPKLEALAKNSPELRPAIAGIKAKVSRGEELTKRRSEVQQVFSREGGPGGCRSDRDCRAYCSDPANGPECISFGAKNQIFKGDEIIQRFQQFNQVLQTQQYPPEFRGPPYPEPNTGPNNYPTGPYQGPAGRPYYPESQVNPERFRPGPGPVGPSPECFAAIQSGDFVTAKEICNVHTTVFTTPRPVPICPGASPGPCQQEGYYRPASIDQNGCSFYGECVPVPGYRTDKKIICPALPTVDTCPEGQRKIISYSSPECGTYYKCEATKEQLPTASGSHFPFTFSDGYRASSREDAGNHCYTIQQKNASLVEECKRVGVYFDNTTPTENACPSGSHSAGDGSGILYCLNDIDDTNGTCYELHSAFRIACPPETISAGNCPSGYHYHSKSNGFCMNNNENPAEGCLDYRGERRISCPAIPAHTYSGSRITLPPPSIACNYNHICDYGESVGSCPIDCGSTVPPPPTICPSGQYWNGRACAPNTIPPPTCPSGQYWYVPTGGGSGYCKTTTTTDCPTGQYWNGTVCINSTTPPPPSTACNYNHICDYGESTGSCPTDCGSTTTPPPSSTTCASGQYWNGTACVTSTTPPSGQKEQIWNSLSLRSYIRTDADLARIDQLKQSCANVPSGANIWLPGSGNSTSPDFGMPDSVKCQKAASCTSTQYFDGSSCVSSGNTGGSCPAGQYWYVPSGGGAGYCQSTSTTPPSSSTCDSNLTALLGSGCHQMYTDSSGNFIFCDGPMSKSAKRGDTTTTTGCISPAGGTTVCPSGQYWNGTACAPTSTTTPPPSTTSTCSSTPSLCTTQTDCNRYNFYWCSNATCSSNSSLCQGATSTSCPSGQYWYVPTGGGSGYCKTTTTTDCPTGQYWNGTSCMTSTTPPPITPPPSSTTCASGQYWNGTACVTSTTPPPSPPPSSTSCTGGKYWDGTACSCPNGQHWDGTACMTTTTCASGQYWNGTSCVTSTTPPPSPPPSSTSCPSGQYWTGTACAPNPTPPPSSSTTCPSGQYWSGTACVTSTAPPPPPPPPPPTSMNSETYMFAQLLNSLKQLSDLISRLAR